jgi:hypothetical protein
MIEQFHMKRRLTLILIALALSLSLQLSCAQAATVVNQQNHAPVIEKVTYDKFTYHNRAVKIECFANDIDGDNLTYVWEARDGKISGEGKSVLWTPPGNMQNYPIKLTVTDSKGGIAEKTIYIMVVTSADGTNTPNIEVKLRLGDNSTVVIDNQRVGIWTTADILCVVENTGDSDLIYEWSADCGRIQGKGSGDSKANTIRWIAPGVQSNCTVEVTVTDTQKGSEARGQVNFNVFCCGKELTQD